MAKMYTSLMLHKEPKSSHGSIGLPKGCLGIMFVFSTKKAARAWEGKDVCLCELISATNDSSEPEVKSPK